MPQEMTLCFENPRKRKELYLTASVVLKSGADQESFRQIRDIQDKVEAAIFSANSNIICKAGDLRDRLESKDFETNIVYKYPEDRLHFSAINLLTYVGIEHARFEEERKRLFANRDSLTSGICKIIKENAWSLPVSAQVRRIYLPNRAKVEKSIALNVYPEPGWFDRLRCMKDLFQEELLRHGIMNGGVEIKSYEENSYDYFVINLFRLIGKTEIEDSTPLRTLQKINEEILKRPFEMKISQLDLVVSDPWLANENPKFS